MRIWCTKSMDWLWTTQLLSVGRIVFSFSISKRQSVINWNATAIFLFVSLSPLRICNTHWSWIGHGKVSVDAIRPKFSSLFSCKFSLEKLSGVSFRWWQPKLSSYDVFRGSYTTKVVRWQHPLWGSFQFTLPPLFCSALGGMNDEKFLRQQLYVFEERVRELESATNNEDCAQVHTEQNSSGVFFSQFRLQLT